LILNENLSFAKGSYRSSQGETKKVPAGAKGYDAILLFKILILQSLYNLSDEAMEFQILDRYSFSRFLVIRQGQRFSYFNGFYHFSCFFRQFLAYLCEVLALKL